MAERKEIHNQAEAFFEKIWTGDDLWELQASEFEQSRFARLSQILQGRRYGRVLEIGCGDGSFTRHLANVAEHILALDISPAAIAKARECNSEKTAVEFRIANIMDYDVSNEGPWDLIVMTETIYYLGWLYPFFDVAWLAGELHKAGSPGGRLLLANTFGHIEDPLVLPSLIHTYRDLFLNVGFHKIKEEVFEGMKHRVKLEVLMTIFEKGSSDEENPR